MCRNNCKGLGDKPEVFDVRKGMLSKGPTPGTTTTDFLNDEGATMFSVVTIDPELDKCVDKFLNDVHAEEHPLPLFQEHQDPSKWEPTTRTFESGSVRDNDDDKPLPMELNPYMLIRYGYHMKGAQSRYGDGNWELGQTDIEIWRSMSRHFMQAYMNFKFPEKSKATDDGTDHLSALLFGINMLMHNECSNGVDADKYFKTRK